MWSWGYEQTNLNFFQVTDKRGRNVIVREIAQESVPGSQGFMSESRRPRSGVFLRNATPQTKRLQFLDGRPYLAQPFGWCGLWTGGPHYASWYA